MSGRNSSGFRPRSCREGMKQGEENFAALTEKLLKDFRNEDLLVATRDKAFREQLYREYHIGRSD